MDDADGDKSNERKSDTEDIEGAHNIPYVSMIRSRLKRGTDGVPSYMNVLNNMVSDGLFFPGIKVRASKIDLTKKEQKAIEYLATTKPAINNGLSAEALACMVKKNKEYLATTKPVIGIGLSAKAQPSVIYRPLSLTFCSDVYADKPPKYEDVYKEKVAQLKVLGNHLVPGLYLDSDRYNNMSDRLTAVEQSVTETRHVADQTHQLQQTMSQQMERLEQSLQERQSQFQLSEERLSQRVVEQLLQNTQFQSMIQTREVSMTRAETTDEHMESNPRSHRCNQMKCPCSCHLLNLNEKWKMERGAERRNNRSYSDLKTPSDFKNGTHDLYDYDHKTPNSDQRNEYGRDMSCVKEQESNDELHEVLGACGGDPGGPPSDDSSSDDNSDDGRINKDTRSAQNKGNKKKAWVIDAATWQICLEADGNFEDQAASLLEQRKLPNQYLLNAAYAKCTLSSPVLKDICECICKYIKEKSENIVHVWAAYTYRKDNMVCGNEIVFVVLTTHAYIIGEKDFSIYQRCVLEVKTKKENMEINEKELDSSNRPSMAEIQDLEACLRENAKSLMKEHSELTRVTAGWYRACKNGKGQYSLQKQLCIVLYVHVKGYVPFGEKPFPTQIGKYPVDVREGIFTLCRGPNDYHENLKMGCAIRGEKQGTLGAFIEFENDVDLYGITCAHVVFGNEKLKWIIEHGQVNYPNSETGETVYQPASQTVIAPIGNTVMALYDEGGIGSPGMEIAMIKINQDRWPTVGTFPDDSNYRQNDLELDEPFRFCSGKVAERNSVFHSLKVYMYGGESRLTSGEFRLHGASFRARPFEENILGAEMIMHDQTEIHPLPGKPFATKGDSGALIFANEQNVSELSAVGLFEGIFKGGGNIYTMTPMYAVLEKLRRFGQKDCALKKLPPYHSRLEDPRLGVDLYQKVSSLSENVTVLSEKLEKMDRGFAKDLEKHKKEITEGLQKHSEEQTRQTLELKDQQKRQSEKHEKQTQEVKDQTTQILNLLQRQIAS